MGARPPGPAAVDRHPCRHGADEPAQLHPPLPRGGAQRWIATERLRLAQRLLETTDLAIDQVAEAAGFGTSLSLRQRFAEDVGMSPSAYRRAFRQSAGRAA